MSARPPVSLLAALWLAAFAAGADGQGSRPHVSSCRRVVLEGSAEAGQPFRRAVFAGLDLALVPLPAGWRLELIPAGVPISRGEDFAGVATPPYRSVNPLLLTTDFGFRAQDAVGWNPRRFHFAASRATFADLNGLVTRMERGGLSLAQTSSLAQLASRQPEGTLEILDARLVPGIADQSQAAATVATHFATTAHEIEPPAGGAPSPRGRLAAIRFRAALDLPRTLRPAAGLRAIAVPCPAAGNR